MSNTTTKPGEKVATPASDPNANLIDSIEITDEHSLRDLSHSKPGGAATQLPKGGSVQRLGGQNIVTVEMPKEQMVQQFEPGRIRDTRGIRYSDVVKGIAPGTATQQSSRFRLNALTRGPLSVEQEEEERIENEVRKRLDARLEEMRAQVTADAYHEGFNAGKEQGRVEVLTEAGPQLAQLKKLATDFEGLKTEVFRANEELFIHLVNQISKAVILRELKEDNEYTRRLATHVLERLGTRENIKIFVAEAELSSAEQLKAGLAQTLGELKNISVEADASMKSGGCRVETEFGEIDARIEVQLQSIASGLGTDQK
ncbi:MAG: hypothetical protein HY075_15570 [Deltaproteobacteria bacterium]|nr:hypothetical protein [Deltaproteobacteria bacterium]